MLLEESIPAVWASLNSWFTPTFLFVFLNLMIGTIAVASGGFGTNQKQTQDPNNNNQQPHQLFRSPSVLQRIRSINLSRFRSQDLSTTPFSSITTTTTTQPPPPQSTTEQSFQHVLDEFHEQNAFDNLENLQSHTHTSIDDDSVISESQTPTTFQHVLDDFHEQHAFDNLEDLQSRTHTSIDDDSVISESQTPTTFQHVLDDFHEQHAFDNLEDLQSHTHTSIDDDSVISESETPTTFHNMEEDHHMVRTLTDTKPASGNMPVKLSKKMKKSASAKSAFSHFEEQEMANLALRPSTVREGKKKELQSFGDDEEVDAKADDFINKFKQQLKLQRLDSILRYKEMLGRGTHEN